jgi:hypothetical protein
MNMTKKPHWTQTLEGRERMSSLQKIAHARVKQAKLDTMKSTNGIKAATKTKTDKQTILIINGWKVILTKDEIRIEN